MSEDRKPRPDNDDTGAIEPPSAGPKPGDAVGESEPSTGAPYEKKPDPEQQPS